MSVPSGEKKIFVLDTNILIHDPHAPEKFDEHWVVIPMKVIEELDELKNRSGQMANIGTLARQASRVIRELQDKKDGSLRSGIPTKGGGKIFVDYSAEEAPRLLPDELSAHKNDNLIIGVALKCQRRYSDRQVVLITKDNNMRIKADGCGLAVEDYTHDRIITNLDDLDSGSATLDVDPAVLNELIRSGALPVRKLELSTQLLANTCCVLRSGSEDALAIFKKQSGLLERIDWRPGKRAENNRCDGPINIEQAELLALLMDPSIPLVCATGDAGTGKTLMALLAGYKQFALYPRMLVYRPIIELGKEMGFLPGGIDRKFAPWMIPIIDNLELIVGDYDKNDFYKKEEEPRTARKGRAGRRVKNSDFEQNPETLQGNKPSKVSDLLRSGLITINPITYVRGRSLHSDFILIDEAQNLTPHEVKTLITRVGEGSKIVLTGDPKQIDSPWLDAISNGLSYVVERFKDQPLFGHIKMIKGERSQLSELAANLL